jgi:PAS domain S-box-containing protein
MIDLEGDPGSWAESLHGFCRAVLAGVPGGAVVVFDAELRVRFAEGESMGLAGLGSLVGRRLPDVLPAASWELLRASYEAALGGETSTCDFTAGSMLLSVHVSPFSWGELGRGGLAVSREVGEQRRLESAVVVGEGAVWASEELFRAAFEHAPLGISVIGLDGRRLRVNEACCRIAGYSREEMVGSDLGDFTHPEDVARDQQFLAAALAGEGDHLEREKRYLHRDGSVLWVQAQSEMVRDGLGNPLFVVAHIQDISDRRVAREQRRASDRTLRAVIDHSPAVICVKDRDLRFELVNHEFEEWCDLPSEQILGHTAAELAVGPMAEGGRAMDEQVLESGEASQEEEMLVRGDQQRAFLTLRFPLFDDDLAVQSVCSMSTDISERRDEERTKQERLQCSVDIHAALAQDRFVLHGQPILNLVSMQVDQAELLLRMLDANGGHKLLAPGEFLPAAERFGQIGLIDEWVLDRAVELAAAGHRVEVNLSAKTISDPGQIDRIEQVVIQSGASPQNLIFEITETAVAENLEAARAFAIRLRSLGCAFALDDFGIGHGTFTYLQHLPVDYLKIDLSFVRRLLRRDSNRDVVLAIIGVAKQFGIKTIAEGIEDQATLDELRRMGVDYAQGYWIGRPVALDQLWKPTDDQEK